MPFMTNPEIQVTACLERQKRVTSILVERGIEALLVTQIEHVQYLTGVRFGSLFQPAALLQANGHMTLIAPQKAPELAAANAIVTYTAKWHSTMRNDQRAESADVLLKLRAEEHPFTRLAVEFSSYSQHYDGLGCELVDFEPELYKLRRHKQSHELAHLRVAIEATEKMYAVARSIIKPGLNELTMFNALQSAAVEHCGEMLTGTGNDYQSNSRGGAPRNRKIEAGELYILDLGPAYKGYFADNARTFAVSSVSAIQHEAWQRVCEVFTHVEQTVRPGKSCRELFQEVQTMLDQAPVGKFNHHLGHGIGLFPHEAPHLNPHWDDTFAVGDVFTVEPGLYAPELCAGLRLENDYLVTETGIELLNHFPLELK
jgi:Xaa-Pro dipeptidase